jgi:murein DD-endopeptidase
VRTVLGVLVLLTAPAAAQEPAAGRCGEWQRATAKVKGSVAGTVAAAAGDDGSQVAAHFARIFMWDLDLRHDVDAGDELRILWRPHPGDQPEIGAASYRSQRLGKLLRAYRFRAQGDDYPSYWDEEGREVARCLKATPLAHYDQITALLKDRPTHQGMDFKTPVGTPVQAPRAGVVTRTNWKLSGNGHCLELRYEDGTLAKFLHLESIQVHPGDRVRAGQVVARSGNTGHSTAPHLHYQLARGTRIVDPVDYHGVTRRRLESADLRALQAQVAALRRQCGEAAP